MKERTKENLAFSISANRNYKEGHFDIIVQLVSLKPPRIRVQNVNIRRQKDLNYRSKAQRSSLYSLPNKYFPNSNFKMAWYTLGIKSQIISGYKSIQLH